MSKVKANDTVKVHYTGKLTNGQVFDTSAEREPLQAQLGQGQLIPGFENALIDMAVNEKKTVTIAKAEAYGDVRTELFQKISKEELPKEITPEVGMGLMASRPDGSQQQLRVAEVNEDHIVIDANHPLAGQDLIFDLEVVGIN
ncbi:MULTISPECIES: FKBP-type peptidyl-prolyl cis-trans isomerase [Mesoflavibacter]|uniref:Peptidyl-prolyl cis-trans isomerase n=1 Tax=Mesoflavibacter profundi TaxID=2708110 RepID=A0ABT4RXR1_9FLAO|nr:MULTISPECIES: peptidylprolyl isomerase [Mesoflavibacter]MDA0176607.1 peptidylprolyl isomerase [Mesoflavibacter profundi]QIJ90264.1 FKBP-type peptidyl-prolyl cis-trans isomerase SlyD [Mesoflavibacter sp. HG96]QIJ92992.1 FKBP-type peptidyl-prolyl cis-trans isomerase SlyD [Mesoflavibacter sp. HG37]